MQRANIEETLAELRFVNEAAKMLGSNKEMCTFGEIEPGQLFALRWGMDNNGIVVFKIAEEYPIKNYANVIKNT